MCTESLLSLRTERVEPGQARAEKRRMSRLTSLSLARMNLDSSRASSVVCCWHDLEVQANVLQEMVPNVSGRPIKVNVELDNGQHVEIDLDAWAAAQRDDTAEEDSPPARSPTPQNEEDIDFYMAVDPDLNIPTAPRPHVGLFLFRAF